ncbi:MAG: hypothetical protein ABEI13_00760 [Candidatus Paceibacteria bacterium]
MKWDYRDILPISPLKYWVDKIDDRYDIFPIYAPNAKKYAIILSFPVLLAPFGYVFLACSTDWFTVSGLLIDIFGATILAIPDLPRYNELTYGGLVREAHLRLMYDEKPGRIAPDTRYYDSFCEALKQRLPPSDIPENGYFDVELMGSDYNMIVKNKNLEYTDVPPISIGNIERELTEVYRNEEGAFRRLGVLLLVIGLILQLLSLIVDSFIVYDLCNI